MWTHEIETSADGEEIELEQLYLGSLFNLEITRDSDGRYWPVAVGQEELTDIGMADTLDAAKALAEKWALEQITAMLAALGGGYCIASASSGGVAGNA